MGDFEPLPQEVDWKAGQELTGCSARQVKFVQAVVAGANNTQAARQAGYRGNGAALRSVACRIAGSHKVKALKAWAEAGGGGPSGEPGDMAELMRVLWKHARGADKSHAMKAIEILNRLKQQEHERGEALADDGFGHWRLARDLMAMSDDGAAAMVLLHPASLASLPLLHDLAPRVQRSWPELWSKLLNRQSPSQRVELEVQLSDPAWQRGARERLWGERGWVIGSDGEAKPDPLGRTHVEATTPLPTHGRDTKSKPNGHATSAPEGSELVGQAAA